MSKVIASVASGDPNASSISGAEAMVVSAPVVLPVQEIPSSVNSHVHLPTPPPSRSSDGSPQSTAQFQCVQNLSSTTTKPTVPQQPEVSASQNITPIVSSQPDFKQIENQMRAFIGQPQVSLPFSTQPAILTSTTQQTVPSSIPASLSSPATSILSSSPMNLLNNQRMAMAQNQQNSTEYFLSLMQLAGISLSSITPQQMANPSLYIAQLAKTNPAILDALRFMQMQPTYQLQQLAQAQSKQQQFMQFANSNMVNMMGQRQQVPQQMTEHQQLYEQLLHKQREVKVEPPSSIPNMVNEDVRHYWFNQSKYPLCWKGNLAMKSNDTRVQMHLISGNSKLIETTAKELAEPEDGIMTIRINQRMRLCNLSSVCDKMNNSDDYVALICLPCGNNVDQVVTQTNKMSSSFISYFTSKMAAGVVTHTTRHANPSCVAHIFPPCDWAECQLNRLAPDFAKEIDKVQPTYLFVVVTQKESSAIKQELNGHISVPLMPQALNCGKTV